MRAAARAREDALSLTRMQHYNLASLIGLAVNAPEKFPKSKEYLGIPEPRNDAVAEAKLESALMAMAMRSAEKS